MTVALIVAAGSGERLGADRPKALVELGGRPLVAWSIDALLATPGIERIVIAMPPGAAASLDLSAENRITVVDGGSSRSDSVRRALNAARQPDAAGGHTSEQGQGDDELVLVHDAARPLLTPALAASVIAALARDPDAHAAIAAVPVTDTVKRVDSDGAVHETLERSELWAVQTPQVFRRAALERALDIPPTSSHARRTMPG